MTDDFEKELIERIGNAISTGDDATLLQELNEYIGLLRELNRMEEAYAIGDKIVALLEKMNLKDTVPYGTSLLNIATAYRMGGRLEEALKLYSEVKEVYLKTLPEDSMLMASLYNNMSLLLQEMGDINSSIEALKSALYIAEKNEAVYEAAVTNANLANSYLALGDKEKAKAHALKAKELFESDNDLDTHYAAALYVLGNLEEDKAGALSHLSEALKIMERDLGQNEFYFRINDAMEKKGYKAENGLSLSKSFYSEYFKDIIANEFKDYSHKLAVGLVGRGSDCFGYDDEYSRDHDWGPGFLIWTDKETYAAIGDKLQAAYDGLPKEYKGYKVAPVVSGHKRRGVFVIEDFYIDLLGKWPIEKIDYLSIPDYAFATAVNGQIFTDYAGEFTRIRNILLAGYPKSVLLKKVAETAALFCQNLEYNYERALKRGDVITADIFKAEGLKYALKLAHLLENKYPPHDKWLLRSAESLDIAPGFLPIFMAVYKGENPATLGAFFANYMYQNGFISDVDDYLDHHVEELLFKSEIVDLTHEELVNRITKAEFAAFDEVENEGGRASCQDDFFTFDIMRKSQYLTWTDEMLLQLIYDFEMEGKKGHNLITEKYGRMMESTAPKRYAEIKDNFPEISPEKKQIIEAVVKIQVTWMEEFAAKYPKLAGKARSIHTYEDGPYNTSYETYLRGEISTYSDKMLQLYAAFIASYARQGENLAFATFTNTVHLYGYASLDEAK